MQKPSESADSLQNGTHISGDVQHVGAQLPVYINESRTETELMAHHYDVSKYERPSVTVDVLMMSLRQRDLQILLIKRRSWPYEGMWAIPGGFVNMDES